MASASLSAIPKWQVLDGNGVPLAGAKLYAYEVGTSNPKDLYTDYQATSTAAWPLVFDSDGRAEVWVGSGLYKMVLTDANDVIIWTVDGIGGSGGGVGSAIVVNTVIGATDSLVDLDPGAATLVSVLGYRAIGDEGGGTFYWDDSLTSDDAGVYVKPSSLSITDPGRWVRLLNEGQPINVRWYGAYGTSLQDDAPFIDKAIVYAAAAKKAILIPKGVFYLDTDPGFVYNVPVKMEPEGSFQWYNLSGLKIAPIVGLDDFSRHFDCNFTSTGYEPVFPGGTISYPDWFCNVTQTLGTGDDDLKPIQSAINSVKTNGGTVKIRSGTYVISTSIILGSNVKIEGDGESSIIQCGNATHPFQNNPIILETGIPAFTHDTSAEVLSNVELCNLAINGNFPGDGSWSAPIVANTSNSKFHDLKIYNTAYSLTLGGNYGDSSYVSVYDNYLLNCGHFSSSGGVLIYNGEQITIRNNLIRQPDYNGTFSGQYSIAIDLPYTKQGVTDCNITDNSCNAPIFTGPWYSDYTSVRNIKLERNTIDIATGFLAISSAVEVGGNYGGPAGNVVINDNVIKMHEAGYGISLSASGHIADSYTVTNNNFMVEGIGSGSHLIHLDGVYSPRTILEGNTAESDVTTNSKFIYENACTGIQYGVNPTKNFNNPIYGGNDSSTFSVGTIIGNMILSGNLTLGGSFINQAFTNLFRTMIVGLDTTNGGVNSSKLKVNPGSCVSTNLGGYMMNLVSSITKDTTSTWAAGNNNGGMAAGVTATDGTGYHFFIIGKTSDQTTIDAGFDIDPDASNLMATAAVVSAGYTTYRRVGWGYRITYAYQLNSFWQKGDYFNYDKYAISSYAYLTGADRSSLRVDAAPLGVNVQVRIACDAWTTNQSDPTNVFYFFDGIGTSNPAYVGVAANHTTRWWDPPAVESRLWVDTSGQIGITSVSTGESPAPVTPVNCRVTMLGWMDPRGKY